MIHFPSIDSTNTFAKEHFFELPDGELITAGEQTAGRGRLDRKWLSPRGNIYASFILKNIDTPLLGMAAGSLAVLDLVRMLAPGVEFHIKWPNDIFHGTAKIAGVLSEGICAPHGGFAGLVVGMGINLNMTAAQLAEAAQEAASIRTLTGLPCGLNAALTEFESLLLSHADRLRRDPDAIFHQWKLENGLLGREVEFDTASGSRIHGLFRDIAPDGAVLLESGGETFRLDCGDVRLLTRA